MTEELTVKTRLEIKAPPEKVWEALTNPEMTRQYMFCEVESDWEQGSPIQWKGMDRKGKPVVFVKGNIVDIEPHRLLRFTMFDPNKGCADIPENYVMVTYDLDATESGTILRITQGDYTVIEKGALIYEETVQGWEITLPVLKRLLESGESR